MNTEKRDLSRRDFLDQGKALVAGAVAGGAIVGLGGKIQERAIEIGLAEFLTPAMMNVQIAIENLKNNDLARALEALEAIKTSFRKSAGAKDSGSADVLKLVANDLKKEWAPEKTEGK